MLVRLLTPLLAFALGAGATLGLASVEPTAATEPALRQLAVVSREPWLDDEEAWRTATRAAVAREEAARAARYDAGRVDAVWEVPPQPGFPGGRIVAGRFDHHASCEAARVDLRAVSFTLTGGPTRALLLREGSTRLRAHVVRAAGASEALVILERACWRAGDALTLCAWDLGRGALDELLTIGGEEATGVSWTLESTRLTIRGLRGTHLRYVDAAWTAERRCSLQLVFSFPGRSWPSGDTPLK